MMSECKTYVYPQQEIFTSVIAGEIHPLVLSQSPAGQMRNYTSDAAAWQICPLPGVVWLDGIRQSQSYMPST